MLLRRHHKMVKVNDLFPLGPDVVKATKKLKHQVQKASVAADKQSELDLSVVGIKIKQQQSDGDTSKVEKEK